MAVLADHHQHAGLGTQTPDLRLHLELGAHVAEELVQRGGIGQVFGRLEVHAHEEQARAVIALDVAELL